MIILLITPGLLQLGSDIGANHSKERSSQDLLNGSDIKKDISDHLRNAPRAFTENRGQLENDEVRFYDQGGAVWFTDSGVWFELREYAESRGRGLGYRGQGGVSGLDFDPMSDCEPPEPVEYKRVVLKQEFVGANQVRPVGRDKLSWNSNFFYGNDPEKWQANVPNYREIFYENIYDGIDLRYYSSDKGLKYDFIVKPGGKIDKIRVRCLGADGLKTDNQGNLIIQTRIKDIFDVNLICYQDFDNLRNQLNGRFKIFNNKEYSFEIIDSYHEDKLLIIDPNVILNYSTYIGGASWDYGYDIAVDLMDNAYVTGTTGSSNFPTTPGANDTTFNLGNNDIFILKINQMGSALIYSTFVGGSDVDTYPKIVIDSIGNAYVSGFTRSSDFPIT